MSTRSARLAGLSDYFSTHHGVAPTAAFRALGFSTSGIQRLVHDGLIVPILPGVYRSAAVPDGPQQLMAAVCAADEAAAIGFTTAGRHFGYRKMGDDQRVHALVPHGHTPTWPNVVIHRSRSIEDVDITLDGDGGIRFTSPPRTVLDCAGIIGHESTESVVEQVLRDKSVTIATLMSTAARLYHHSRPGAKVLRDVLRSRPAWRQAARSELERTFRAAIEVHGLPTPGVNEKVALPDGTVIEVDLTWLAWCVVGEVDHPFWHDGAAESHRDKRRDRKLLTIGIETMRFTDIDVEASLDESLGDLETVLRRRGWSPGAIRVGE
jgi:hypothetical protein